jgi:hypothetical protein
METTAAGAWEPEVLEQAVPEIPEPPSRRAGEPYSGPEVKLGPYLEKVEVLGELSDGLGKKFAIVCPWIHEHTGGDRSGTRIGQRASGPLWFHCDHEHCEGRSWREFKQESRRKQRRYTLSLKRGGLNITLEVNHD